MQFSLQLCATFIGVVLAAPIRESAMNEVHEREVCSSILDGFSDQPLHAKADGVMIHIGRKCQPITARVLASRDC